MGCYILKKKRFLILLILIAGRHIKSRCLDTKADNNDNDNDNDNDNNKANNNNNNNELRKSGIVFLTWDKTKEGLCALYRRCKYRHMNNEEDEVTLVSVYRDQRGQLKIGEMGRGGEEEERAGDRGGREEERAGASINQSFEF